MCIIGKKFNKLTAIKEVYETNKSGRRRPAVECQCECGNYTCVLRYRLLSGHTKSCGCVKKNRDHNFQDITGKKFGKLTVIKLQGDVYHGKKRKYKKRKWKCQCECGSVLDVIGSSLISGNTLSCGCLLSEVMRQTRFRDLEGKKFGRLCVIEFHKRIEKHVIWKCLCECGNYTMVRANNLLSGGTKSCGCLFLEKVTKHGLSRKPGYTKYLLDESPERKLKRYVGNQIRKSFKAINLIKGGKTFDHLPYTPLQLKKHLEKLWESWMSWDNYGDWHIDHIVPHSSFHYTSLADPEFVKCWSLKNLRPLEKIANMKKGAKIIEN
jgi:hypothetical protein